MSDVRAHAGVARGVGEAFAPSILMKSNLWSNWSYIAVGHARSARTARMAVIDGWAREPKDTSGIGAETNASLVAIAAVAFAIEAFHADLAPYVGRSSDTRVARGKVRGYMIDTFRQSLKAANRWQKDWEFVFDLRDDAVHFIGLNNPPEPHPAIPTSVAKEHIRFSTESADGAVAFLVRMWRDLFAASSVSAFSAWTKDRQHVLDAFLAYVGA